MARYLLSLPVLIGLACVLASTPAWSHATKHEGNGAACVFMPENMLFLFDRADAPSNVTEEQFNQIVDEAVAIYEPIAEIQGAKIVSNKNWQSSTVNASASQYQSSWYINMYGGLARRPEVTPDGFAMVVCHELGHHFGGFPFYADSWAAAEGQADYYGLQVCSRLLWSDEPEENAKYREIAQAYEKEKCDASWEAEADRDLCYRASQAGLSLAKLLAALGGKDEPKFDTPDPRQVKATSTSHPAAQCRLDTYFNAALCTATGTTELIPGKAVEDGIDSEQAEAEAKLYSCFATEESTTGSRPRCWFKPRG